MDRRDYAVILIFVALVGFQFFHQVASSVKNMVLFRHPVQQKQIPQKTDFFANIPLEAKSAIVWDARDNLALFAKNEKTQLPLASLAKIMTAYVALTTGDKTVIVSHQAIEEEGDSGLLSGEEWNLSDLAKLTLVASANDGANSLATAWVGAEKARGNETSFVDAMNAQAKILGLSQTYFLNETGLDLSNGTAGAYGSAEDIAKFFYRAVSAYPGVFEATGRRELTTYSLQQKKHVVLNTNGDVEKIPGIVASKTGFTALSGGNLLVIIDIGINHPIVIGVLGSSFNGRFADMEKLVSAAIMAVSNSISNEMK